MHYARCVPTVADRIAQEVARRYLEPILEPVFHADSYGYRPGKSAVDAVRKARERCWRYDWVLDLDIKGFFDSIDWELMLRAVRRHTDCPWVLLYIERWLKAPVQMEDGSIVARTAGTPQGGVISPLLANLFLHYAFDMWMRREFPHIPFERYADDVICHCKSAEEARALWSAIADRFAACKLVLHPEKTKIVYCKDVNRSGVASDPEEDRCLCHPVGTSQVQAHAPPDQRREGLVRPATPRQTNSVRPLGIMPWQRPDIGSRVTREGHARFWERPEAKFLRATRQTRTPSLGAARPLPPSADMVREGSPLVKLRNSA